MVKSVLATFLLLKVFSAVCSFLALYLEFIIDLISVKWKIHLGGKVLFVLE